MKNKKQAKKQTIKLNDQIIDYTLKTSPRARYMRLTIDQTGSLTVTKPWGLSQRRIEKFIRQKASWVLSRLQARQNQPSYLQRYSHQHYLQHREQARRLIQQKTNQLNANYNFQYQRISVRNQKTRWGSCSAKGNLNFNYRILFLPDRLVDYIIVHELCHLQEMNHSQRFWNLVATVIPEYKEVKQSMGRHIKLQ